MPQSKNLFVYQSPELLNKDVAWRMVNLANAAISQRGTFRVALAGGSTPRGLYKMLGSDEYANKTNWSLWQVYFSDERLFPLTQAGSNYAMANETLFASGHFQRNFIYPVPVQSNNASKAAAKYEAQIKHNFSLNDDSSSIPRFDLILLGLGSDGHTASLFPGKPAVNVVNRLVIESPPGVLPPPVDRVTFSIPLINATRHAMFLVSGEDKQAAFRAAYSSEALDGDYLIPARLVMPSSGNVDWHVTNEVVG